MTQEDTQKAEPITNHQSDSVSNIERLIIEISDTNQFLRRVFSFRMILLRGLLSGFAFVIGSTVLVSLIISAVALIFGDASTLRELLNQAR